MKRRKKSKAKKLTPAEIKKALGAYKVIKVGKVTPI